MTKRKTTTTPSRGVDDASRQANAAAAPARTRSRGGVILTLPRAANILSAPTGEVAEWLNAPVSKTGLPARVAGVRISPSPLE